MEVKIRYATDKDIAGILPLLYELERPKATNELERKAFVNIIRLFLSGQNNKILLALDQSSANISILIGMLSCVVILRLNQRKSELWIPELIVSEEYRSKGVGTMLLNESELIARQYHCYRIRLESRNDRIVSHLFYKKNGYKQSALMFEKTLA